MGTATAQVFTLPEREFQQAIAELLGRKEYGKVREAVQSARERDPKNIFLIAIDRQVRKLEELLAVDGTEIEERTRTEESLAQLIQRAWADATTRGIVLTLPADAVIAPAHVRASVPAAPIEPVKAPAAPTARVKSEPAVATSALPTGRRFPATMVVAIVLTVSVIGMGITYLVHRKGQRPDQVTLMAKDPVGNTLPASAVPDNASPAAPAADNVLPASDATNNDSRKPEIAPSPTAETGKKSAGRERSRTHSDRTGQESGKGSRTEEKAPVRQLTVPEQSRPASGPGKVAAGFSQPVTREAASSAQPAEESAQPFIPVQKEPRVVRLVDPELGDAALKFGKEGEVIARVLIGTDGKPLKVRILKSTNTFLNKPVAEALLRSEFEPGVMTAGPVQSWLTVPFKFR